MQTATLVAAFHRVVLLVFTLIMSGCAIIADPHLVEVDASVPVDFPDESYSHSSFEQLLARYVDASGEVDYDRWHRSADDIDSLDSYLAAVGAYSPENAPERFAKRSDELAYWLYSYNAYVIKSVLNKWPLDSVTDIKAPVEIVRGFGFFYSQRFLFGGAEYSLYKVENDKIRDRYKDARIHFVLNCGSESCPVLRPELPTGDALEPYLATAATEFVADPRNVTIDHDAKRVRLNEIFKWFKKDFINDLRRRGLPSDRGLIDYVASVAPPEMRADLERASDYKVVFADYDWSINKSAETSGA